MDLDAPRSVGRALAGTSHAVYLAHSMLAGNDYPERERRSAIAFGEQASEQGLSRIVYLGGVQPNGRRSKHLQSRLDTGVILRAGPVDVVELRAAMVIGHGSASWQMVRDLTVRLPLMLLPRWLQNRSSPVAIDDVIVAIAASLLGAVGPGWYDVPGPETLTHRSLMQRVAKLLGRTLPTARLPVVTPTLSAYWIAAITRVPYPLARELVGGLTSDLLPSEEHSIWRRVAHSPGPLDNAILNAFADESTLVSPSRATTERIGHRLTALWARASEGSR